MHSKIIGRRVWPGLRLMLIVSMLWVSPASLSGKASGQPRQADVLSTPISAVVALDHIPLIGEPATLSCTVTSTLDAPGTAIRLELPENVTLLAGSLTWRGDLSANTPFTLPAQVIFNQSGDQAVFCRALRVINGNSAWGDLAGAYVSLGQKSSQSGFAATTAADRFATAESLVKGDGQLLDNDGKSLPPARLQNPESIPSTEPASQNAPSQPLTSAATGDLTVTGRWQYYDRSGTLTGGRDMLVQVVRGDDGTSLASCYTSLDGSYSCGPVPNPGEAGVRTVMYSYTSFTPYGDVLVVVNPDMGTTGTINNAYGVTQPAATVLADGTQSIGEWALTLGDFRERAFWVEQDLIDAYRFIWLDTGQEQIPQETTGPVTVEWKLDSTDGTYYIPGQNVHLKGTDPLTNFPSLHEYAHNIMYSAYGNRFPSSYCPSPHYINTLVHVNCAWTEGWANFFAMAVNDDPIIHWPSGSWMNLEIPTWGTQGWENGDGVEGRVTGTLWDILDSANDGYDTYTDGDIANIWDTLYHQPDNSNSFVEYASAWVSRSHNQIGAGLAAYQNTIDFVSTAPAAPTGFSASDGTFTDKVQLSWNAVSGATYYLVYRSESERGTKLPAAGAATTSLSGDDLWATPGVVYTYWVKACTATICSDFSLAETGWRGGAGILTPPIVAASDGTYADRVQLYWSTSGGAEYYKVFRSESLDGAKTLGGSVSAFSAADIWASPGVTYYYWLQACNSSTCSAFSAAETGWRKP